MWKESERIGERKRDVEREEKIRERNKYTNWFKREALNENE
jgi:hypothetical protein